MNPTGSTPRKFYGTAKVNELSQGDQVDKLSIRPIISNIDTATYWLAKHLDKLLSALSTSKYTVKRTKHFEKVRTIKVPKGYQIVFFDLKTLFTKVTLEYTIDFILK